MRMKEYSSWIEELRQEFVLLTDSYPEDAMQDFSIMSNKNVEHFLAGMSPKNYARHLIESAGEKNTTFN